MTRPPLSTFNETRSTFGGGAFAKTPQCQNPGPNLQRCVTCCRLLLDLVRIGNAVLDARKNEANASPESLHQARRSWKRVWTRLCRYQRGARCVCPNRLNPGPGRHLNYSA